jgi:hypothetical protein
MRIFLSYRREDSSAWAGRLRDALSARFGKDNIFQDVVAVQPGQDFTDAVDTALRRSDATLAVIGPQWLTAAGADGEPRLADETDYVRSELVAALATTPSVIPVLVGGAAMPTPARLPDELKPLALLQAVTLRDESWHRDVDDLIHTLGGDRLRARPQRWLIAAVVLGGLVAAGAIALMLLNHDGGGQSSSTTAPSNTAGPSTTLSRDAVLSICRNPASSTSEWTPLDVDGTTTVERAGSPTGRLDLINGYYRKGEAGRWEVVLSTKYTNMTDDQQRTHYWGFYRLAIDGLPFHPDCFNVTGGQTTTAPGETSEALVGFDISVAPTNDGTLLVDVWNDIGQIPLIPT